MTSQQRRARNAPLNTCCTYDHDHDGLLMRPLNPARRAGSATTIGPARQIVVLYGIIGLMTPGELGSGRAEAASRRATQVTSPRVLILAAAALVLTNVPLTRYGSGGHQDYFWSSLGVLLAVWQLWAERHVG